MPNSKKRWSSLAAGLPWISLAVLLLFTYARFGAVPYVGFDFNPSSGEIDEVFVDGLKSNELQVGDRLIQIGEIVFESFTDDPYQIFFAGIQAGEKAQLVIERNGQERAVQWVLPGINQGELIDRLINVWWIGFIFWGVGTTAFLTIRPKDTRWWLFLGFNYLTAIWLVVGSIARWQVWGSVVLFRSTIWLSVPIYLHLHWIFPKPFAAKPKALLRGLLRGVYGLSLLLAMAEWFGIFPGSTYYLGFLFAVVSSIVLLVLHYVRQKEQRYVVRLLAILAMLALLPAIVLSVVTLVFDAPMRGGGSLLALPILPLAYFYAIHRRQLGGLETRANRILSAYVYFILVGTVIFSIYPLMLNVQLTAQLLGLLSAVMALLMSIFVSITYPRFARWFEQHVLKIPLNVNHLVDQYSGQVTSSLNAADLTRLITETILPSLMIRQSALLRIESGVVKTWMATGGGDELNFSVEQVEVLRSQARRYLPLADLVQELIPAWVRLVIPLQVNGATIGLWLFGRKDPDDFYTQFEIGLLDTLVNQTAIALVNIEQANRLHALYQASLDLQEAERTAIARELHDDILNQMAVLSMKLGVDHSPELVAGYTQITTSLRQMVSMLRPAMLQYGLTSALEEYIDELSERVDQQCEFSLAIEGEDVRYDPKIEEHLFRIVQQACENALRHAQAKTIRVQGMLALDRVELTIQDDGVGLEHEQLDFNSLLANKHFGLAGMFERADLIGAELKFVSSQQPGTTASIHWSGKENSCS